MFVTLIENGFLPLAVLIIGAVIIDRLAKPKVFLQIKRSKNPYQNTEVLGYFSSLIITNTGRKKSENCIGRLFIDFPKDNIINPEDYSQINQNEIALPSSNEKIRHQLILPNNVRELKGEPLCWGKLGNPEHVNINPGGTEILDVCRIQFYNNVDRQSDSFWYVIFPSEQGWKKIRCRVKILEGQELNGKLLITTANSLPKIKKFNIKLDVRGAQFSWLNNSLREKYLKKFRRKYFLSNLYK